MKHTPSFWDTQGEFSEDMQRSESLEATSCSGCLREQFVSAEEQHSWFGGQVLFASVNIYRDMRYGMLSSFCA